MADKCFGMAFAALLLWSCAGFAGEASVVRNQVWKAYLSPSEQAAQALLVPEEKEPQAEAEAAPGSSPDLAALAALAAEGRKGFVELMAELAPPLPGLEGEPFGEGGVSGRWFRTEGAASDRVMLYFHGGGFMLGSAATSASIAGFLAKESGIPVFSLEYPLAPEAPYPAQLESAYAAYRMLLAKGYKPGNIVVGGDSAGGNLALVLLLRLRGAALPMPAGAYLISPWADATHVSGTHESKAFVDTALNREMIELMAAAFLGERDRRDPLVSPAHADLRGLPPLLVQAGSFETLLDDSLIVARNAALADVPVWLSVWPGYTHDFQMFGSRLEGGRRALREASAFLLRALDGTLLRD